MNCLKKMLELLLRLIFRKDVEKMAMAYATLIIKGKKTYKEVPAKLKNQVAEILMDLDCEYLIEE